MLLTHIHLDHAGATGTIVRAHPHIRVLVHERGAPHMADPTKLLAQRDAAVRRPHGSAVGRVRAGAREEPDGRLRAASGSRRAAGRSRSPTRRAMRRITSATSIASSGVAFVGDTGRRLHRRRLRAAADAAARHRHRGVAGQRRAHRGLVAGDAVPDALRAGRHRPAASADAAARTSTTMAALVRASLGRAGHRRGAEPTGSRTTAARAAPADDRGAARVLPRRGAARAAVARAGAVLAEDGS